MRDNLDGIIAALVLMAVVLVIGNAILASKYRDLETQMRANYAVRQAMVEKW